MGCFLACFGGAKDRRLRRRSRRRRPTATPSPLPHVTLLPIPHLPAAPTLLLDNPPKQPASAAGDVQAQELSVVEKPELEGPSSADSSDKKVTFDLNATAYEEAAAVEENSDDEEEAATANKSGESVGNVEAYPLNHRYQNCASSDDEDGIDDDNEEEYDDCDFYNDDDEEDGREGNEEEEEESYESFFSLQLEKARKSCTGEVSSPEPVVVAKGSGRDRSQYIHSVLNPVENLSKWKEVKDHCTNALPKNSMKENVGSELETKGGTFCFEPSFKTRSPSTKPVSSNPSNSGCSAKQEVSVDTSLSNWLVVTPDNSPMKGTQEKNSSARSNPSVSREDRPILGALTIDDLKQSSVNSSPRRSTSRTPDDIPIVGTVGSYWSSSKGGDSSTSPRAPRSVTKGIPNSTSKYREDKKVNWHSTPFEVRLERALNEGSAAEACPARLPAAATSAAVF